MSVTDLCHPMYFLEQLWDTLFIVWYSSGPWDNLYINWDILFINMFIMGHPVKCIGSETLHFGGLGQLWLFVFGLGQLWATLYV